MLLKFICITNLVTPVTDRTWYNDFCYGLVFPFCKLLCTISMVTGFRFFLYILHRPLCTIKKPRVGDWGGIIMTMSAADRLFLQLRYTIITLENWIALKLSSCNGLSQNIFVKLNETMSRSYGENDREIKHFCGGSIWYVNLGYGSQIFAENELRSVVNNSPSRPLTDLQDNGTSCEHGHFCQL